MKSLENPLGSASTEFAGPIETKPGSFVHNHRGTIAKAVVAFALIAWIYAGSIRTLVHDWLTDPGASFGVIIPPLALYVVWWTRKQILAVPVRHDRVGLFVIAAGCLLFLIGQMGAEFFVTRVSLIVVLAGFTWAFWGHGRLKLMTFPFILLLSAVPVPRLLYNKIAIPLQLFASDMSTQLIRTFGGTVYRDGNIIQLPGVTLGIAEACSGLSSLSSLIVAALIVGFLQCNRPVSRLFLLAVSIPLAIGVNILRITGTAVLATYNEEFALGFYHSFAGWLVFVFSFTVLVVCCRILQRTIERSASR